MTRTRPEPAARAGEYWAKALRHAQGAHLVAAHREPAIGAAFTAVVDALDALCVHALGRRNASPHHADALIVLQDVAIPAAIKQRLRKHFQAIARLRHQASYSWEPSSAADARRALDHMDRLLDAVRPLLE